MYFNIFWMVYQVVLLGVGMMMGKMVQQQPAIITHSSPVEKEYSSVGVQTEGAVKDETDDCEDDVTRKASMLSECSSEIASKVDTPWDDLVLKLDDLTFETDPATNEWFLIGSGKFGNVYKAKLFGTEVAEKYPSHGRAPVIVAENVPFCTNVNAHIVMRRE